MPVLFRVKLMEVERFQEVECQQGATETEVFLLCEDPVLFPLGIEIGIVDLFLFIDCYGCGNATIRLLLCTFKECLQSMWFYDDI